MDKVTSDAIKGVSAIIIGLFVYFIYKEILASILFTALGLGIMGINENIRNRVLSSIRFILSNVRGDGTQQRMEESPGGTQSGRDSIKGSVLFDDVNAGRDVNISIETPKEEKQAEHLEKENRKPRVMDLLENILIPVNTTLIENVQAIETGRYLKDWNFPEKKGNREFNLYSIEEVSIGGYASLFGEPEKFLFESFKTDESLTEIEKDLNEHNSDVARIEKLMEEIIRNLIDTLNFDIERVHKKEPEKSGIEWVVEIAMNCGGDPGKFEESIKSILEPKKSPDAITINLRPEEIDEMWRTLSVSDEKVEIVKKAKEISKVAEELRVKSDQLKDKIKKTGEKYIDEYNLPHDISKQLHEGRKGAIVVR